MRFYAHELISNPQHLKTIQVKTEASASEWQGTSWFLASLKMFQVYKRNREAAAARGAWLWGGGGKATSEPLSPWRF